MKTAHNLPTTTLASRKFKKAYGYGGQQDPNDPAQTQALSTTTGSANNLTKSGNQMQGISNTITAGGSILSGVADAMDQGNKYGRQSGITMGLKQGVSMAASGAKLGSAFGPEGALIGGVAGGTVGLATGLIEAGEAKKKENAMDRVQANEAQQASIAQGNATLAANPNLRFGNAAASDFADGGTLPNPQIPKTNRPTSADSLALYNSSLATKKFYDSDPRYTQRNIYTSANSQSYNSQSGVAEFNDLNHFGLATPNAAHKVVNANNYYRKVNNNQYLQRDISPSVLNTNAPMTLYDKRIEPTKLLNYDYPFDHSMKDPDRKPLMGDRAVVPLYDPKVIKPWSILTPAEKAARVPITKPIPITRTTVAKSTPVSNTTPTVDTTYNPSLLTNGKFMVTKPDGTLGQWGNNLPPTLVPAKPVPSPPLVPSDKASGLSSNYYPSRNQNQSKAIPTIQPSGQYGKGGSIHIKPSHEGRFTAYKQRTGKTTEEALHSSDAHVRKMANFAKNAAGWKKAFGGSIGSGQELPDSQQLPGGSTTPLSQNSVQVNGQSHAQGGVQLPQAEVEGGETIANGFVFSKELGFADLHKPIAKAIGKIEAKPLNPVRRNTLQQLKARELGLALAQESAKHLMGMPSDLIPKQNGN